MDSLGDNYNEEQDLWEEIDEENRDPVKIIYVAEDEVDLDEIASWGTMTGFWDMRIVRSVSEAIRQQSLDPAEVMVLLGTGIDGARRLASKFPYLPLSVANYGGFDGFPSGWPSQVVVAQWAAPRPTEFGHAIATALSKPNTEVIYKANQLDISLFSSVSEELLARLAEAPEERFRLQPRLFEETVAELLSRMGYDVSLTPQSGDKGRDVIANLATPVAPVLMLVECKRYAPHRLVGAEPITRLWFRMFDDKANLSMVVTTSGFQPIARETAQTRGYQISLKDGEQFIEWIRSLKSG